MRLSLAPRREACQRVAFACLILAATVPRT
ncbi:hypothetical protein B0E38_01458 [Streptomyces sp. 111WW2]|nr:hypothetical protein B0E38_01458 [Streptomyces sp. 111WW2]